MSSCALAAIYSFFSRELFLDPLSVAICIHQFFFSPLAPSPFSTLPLTNGASIPSSLTPPSSTMVRMFLPLSSFPLTNGADDASIPHDVGMAASVKQTEMLQLCISQLGLHLRHLLVREALLSRVQPPSPAQRESHADKSLINPYKS